METLQKEATVQFGDGAVKLSPAQEMLFAQLVKEYWAEEAKKVMVHLDNLVFVAQVQAVMMGWM